MNKQIMKYERLIQGDLLKCVDGHWSPTPPPELLVVGTTRALQCWSDGKPIDTIIERPGEPLPDVDELNAKIPQDEWELGLDGKPRAPWQLNYVVYLANTDTGDIFTFANSTTGARIAWERLTDRIDMMQRLRGTRTPLVKLESKEMKTSFGKKLRPEFTIIQFRDLGDGGGGGKQPAQLSPPTDKDSDGVVVKLPGENKKTTVGKPVKPITQQEELDDEIKF